MEITEKQIAVWNLLRDIWPNWRSLALSTEESKRAQAESAAASLYAELGYPAPTMRWMFDKQPEPKKRTIYAREQWITVDARPSPPHYGFPIRIVRDSILYPALVELLPLLTPVSQEVVGYEATTGRFRMESNKRLLFREARRFGQPPWLVDRSNIICRFDVDALALLHAAEAVGVGQSEKSRRIAARVTELLKACFGAVLCIDFCLLIQTPLVIGLDERQMLQAAHPLPAIRWPDGCEMFIRNGQIFDHEEKDGTLVNISRQATPRRKFAWIEFFGWEKFLHAVHKSSNLSSGLGRVGVVCLDRHPRYGTLWRIDNWPDQFFAVEVKNGTPEPNGKYRKFVIPVNPDCRPLPDPRDPRGRLGRPQPLTARNAVASTFGMSGEQYESILGAES